MDCVATPSMDVQIAGGVTRGALAQPCISATRIAA
jgi:hypothetical protein